MANYGGPTQTPFHSVGSSLYGEKNELIAFKPQVLSGAPNDWWYMAGSPDRPASGTLTPGGNVRERGLLFYNRKTGEPGEGRLCWIDEIQTDTSDFAWALPGNRAATITGVHNYFPVTGTVPFTVDPARQGKVTNLHADFLDGYHAEQILCGSGMTNAANKIPVYKALGQLSVGDPVDQCDAVTLRFFQGNQIGVTAMKPVQWATILPLSVTVSDAGMTLTSTANGVFNPDVDTRPGIGVPIASTTEASAHRILVKDQWSSGADTPAIQNGVYYLYNAGSSTTTFVLKRATDADQDGELARSNLVFVEFGGKNAGSQFQLSDKSPSTGTVYGPAITPGTEPNWWQLFFRVSVYIGGRGICIDGQTINFAKCTKYTVGSAFVAGTEDSIAEIPVYADAALPKRYLGHTNVAGAIPNWYFVTWADVTSKPTLFPPDAHTHPPNDIKGGVDNAVGFFVPAVGAVLSYLSGDGLFTYNKAAGKITIGTPGLITNTSGPEFYYPSARIDISATELLSFNSSDGKIQRRTISSITDSLWPTQTGTAFVHTRWSSALNRIQDSFLIDDDAIPSIKPYDPSPVAGVPRIINLGTAATEFGTLYSGKANLGVLEVALTAGTGTPFLLGVEFDNTNRNVVKKFTSGIPASYVTLATNAVAYGVNSTLFGSPSNLYFDGSQFKVPSGTISAPSIGFIGDATVGTEATTGIYKSGVGQVTVAINSSQALKVGETFTSVARDFYTGNASGKLGTFLTPWAEVFLKEIPSTNTLKYLVGNTTLVSPNVAANRVESFSSAQVKAWLGFSGTQIVGSGTKDYFAMWTVDNVLGNAPFKIESVNALNQSLMHLTPGTDFNPTTGSGLDLGFTYKTGGAFGANLITPATNSNFDAGIGNWVKFGEFLTVTAVGGRMVVTIATGGELSHGAYLNTGLTVVGGTRYQVDFKVKVDGAMPIATTEWRVDDLLANLIFDSGQFYSPGLTEQTVTAFATANSSGPSQLRFIEEKGQSVYTVSFELVQVRVPGAGSVNNSLRWRNLYIAPDFTAVPVDSGWSLAAWTSNPRADQAVKGAMPVVQATAAQVRSFIGLTGVVDMLTKFSATGVTNSQIFQVGATMYPFTDKAVLLGKSGLIASGGVRWNGLITNATTTASVFSIAGWATDPSLLDAVVLSQYDATKVKTFLGLSSAVTGTGTQYFIPRWTASGAALEDSFVKQTTTAAPSQDMSPATDGFVDLGKAGASGSRWKSFTTDAGTTAVVTLMAGWESDPSATSGVVLSKYDATKVKTFLGLSNAVTGPGNGFTNRMTKWGSATSIIDSEIHQATGELTSVTDGSITLGKTGVRWSAFWTKTLAPAAPAVPTGGVAGWATDPNAGVGAAMGVYGSAQIRTWLGMGGGTGTGTAHRLTKWDAAGGGPVDTQSTEFLHAVSGQYSLRVDSTAYIDGLIEPFSDLGYVRAIRPQIRAGYYSNQLVNFDVGSPLIINPVTPTLVTSGVTVAGTAGEWRCVYMPVGSATTNIFKAPGAIFTGSGTATFEFTCLRFYFGGSSTWTPFFLMRNSTGAGMVTGVRVEFREGNGTTWTVINDQTPVQWNSANPCAWTGTTTIISANPNALTGVRFIFTFTGASDCRINEVGVVNPHMIPGTSMAGMLHATNRWQNPNLYASYTAAQSAAGTLGCGSNTAPMIALWQANTGIYAAAAGQIDFTANATRQVVITATGLSLGGITPTALLDLNVGGVVRAPFHFAASGNYLLTTPVAGSFETDNNRLWFTNTVNSVATRHGLAFLDDYNQFNDPNAEMSGAVNFSRFYPGSSTVDWAIANMDGQVFANDVSIAIRFRVPVIAANMQSQGLFALTSATGGGGGAPNDWIAYFQSGSFAFIIRTPAGSIDGQNWAIPLATWTPLFGRIIDFVIIRTSGVVSIWINGVNVTPTPTGSSESAKPIAGGLPTLRFHVGGLHSTIGALCERVYSARVYNRALSFAELVDMIRHGVDEQDKWPSTTPIYDSGTKWATGVDGWATIGGVNASGQAIGGKTGTLKITANSAVNVISYKPSILAPRYKRFRQEGNFYLPTANPVAKRIMVGFFNQPSSKFFLPQLPGDAWQSFSQDSGIDANVTSSNQNNEIDMSTSAGNISGSFTSADVLYLDSVKISQIGCVVDLDFGRVIGKQVWDWSGRFPATLAGTYEVVRPKFGTVTVPEGPGTVTVNLRKYTQRLLTVKDNETYTITHNLGVSTAGYGVFAWEVTMDVPTNPTVIKTALSLTVGWVRKTDNTIDVTFDSVGAPTPPGTVSKIVEIVIVA